MQLLAGNSLSLEVLKATIHSDESSTVRKGQRLFRIVRALLNTVTAVRKGMTLFVEEERHPYPTGVSAPVCLRIMSVGQAPASEKAYRTHDMRLQLARFTSTLDVAVDAGVSLVLDRSVALEMLTAEVRGVTGSLSCGTDTGQVRQ